MLQALRAGTAGVAGGAVAWWASGGAACNTLPSAACRGHGANDAGVAAKDARHGRAAVALGWLAAAMGTIVVPWLCLADARQFGPEVLAAPEPAIREGCRRNAHHPCGVAEDDGWRTSLEDSAFNATKLKALDHLIVVAGHAVVLAEDLGNVDKYDSSWYLEKYQRQQDLPPVLVGHIRKGVEATAADPRALLIFSGGQTRPAAGPMDEGSSYYRVAEHYGWWGHAAARRRSSLRRAMPETAMPVPQRTVTEDFAADSFQNLLFSVCRFNEVIGKYPRKVTIVSFAFKRHRFQDLHRVALRFPLEHFHFVGVQPPITSRFNPAEAEHGELEHAARFFEVDPYGCHTPALVAKRAARNPFRRTAPYPLSCPDLRGLLDWCGPQLFPAPLPWTLNDSKLSGKGEAPRGPWWGSSRVAVERRVNEWPRRAGGEEA